MKIPHVTEVWVNFTTQLRLFIKIETENTFFTCGREVENYRLKSRYKIVTVLCVAIITKVR